MTEAQIDAVIALLHRIDSRTEDIQRRLILMERQQRRPVTTIDPDGTKTTVVNWLPRTES